MHSDQAKTKILTYTLTIHV